MVKTILNSLKNNRLVYLFVLIGIILVIFPDRVAGLVPWMAGVSLVAYAIVNFLLAMKFPDSDASLGDAVIKGIVGIVILLMEEKSLTVIGVMWAVLSLYEVAEKIDDYRKSGEIRPINVIGMVLTTILACMLMADPFDHFTFHVMLLGLEMIIAASVRLKKRKKATE